MAKNRKKDDREPIAPPRDEPTAPPAADETTAADAERDRIAARAYELYLGRGGSDGDPTEDWLAAERELTNRQRPDDE